MSRLPRRRVGTRLKHDQQEVAFAPWPLARSSHRIELQSALQAANPWDVVRAAASIRTPPARLVEAEALITQAEELYRVAAAVTRANPMLLYHAFYNLAKALIIVKGHGRLLDGAGEGIFEQCDPGGSVLHSSTILVDPSSDPTIFQLLAGAIGQTAPIPGSAIAVLDLLPQVVVGHRLYRSATGAPEHFAAVQELQFMSNPGERTVWLDLVFDSVRLGRGDLSSSKLIGAGGLDAVFREVESDLAGRRRFEMMRPFSYDLKPWERLDEIVMTVRPYLWTSVGRRSPFSVHHVCLATANRVPQVLGLYLLLFAFSSITRTRPHRFDQLLSDGVGSFVGDLLCRQPEQLLYLLASEFAGIEVVPGNGVDQRPGRGTDQPGFHKRPFEIVGGASA